MIFSATKSSLSFRVYSLAMLLAVLALAFHPMRATAQQSSPAPAASTPQSGSQSAQPASSGDDAESALLHSPVVQSIARILHLKLDTAINLMLGLNFAIIFFAIAIPLVRITPKIVRKRSQTLSHDLSEARNATADAQSRLKAVEAKLAGLGEEMKKFAEQMEQESQEDERRIKATLDEESARIVAAAEQEIEMTVTQAKRGLRRLAADLAIAQAEKQIVLTPETDRALIAEFVAEVSGQAAGKGGRN